MERRPPKSPEGRSRAPKSGLESGFRKRSNAATGEKPSGKSSGNFSTRDGKEGFRADERSKRDFSDKPKRSYSDRPRREDGDRPARSFDDRPKRDFSDKPKRDFGDRPKRDFADKPKRDFGDKPKRSYGDRPQRDNTDRPARSYEDRPKRDFSDKPNRDFGDKPKRDFGDRPKRDFGDKPQRSYDDRPERGSYSDKPKRSYGDKPQRDFGDRPKRDFGDKPKRDFGDRPKRDFGDKPKRSYGDRDRPQWDKPRDRDDRPARNHGPRIEASVYGIHAVTAALLNPAREIKAVYATEADLADLQPTLDQALEDGIILPEVTIVEREALNRALPKDAVHQGVALDAKPLEETFLQDIIRKADVKKKSLVVLLDQVTDPHNIGAILRSACAFGADAIVVQSRNAPELSGLIAKTASGAAEYVPLVYETNLSRAIVALKEAGFFCLALDEKGQSINEAPTYEKTLLVFGAEGPGLRPLIRENCDLLVKLPTSGPISSLNVSNAAAIALFSVVSRKA